MHPNLEISTCDPLIYKMSNSILILSTCMGKSIRMKMVNMAFLLGKTFLHLLMGKNVSKIRNLTARLYSQLSMNCFKEANSPKMHYFFNCIKNGKSSKTCKHIMVNDRGDLQSTFF